MIELATGGTLARGRYRLEERVGSGGMATVWRATDERLRRPVAVKIISEALAGDEAYLERFQREARIAAQLSHRALVKLFDYDVDEGRPFLVMEYVEGGTLHECLTRGEAVDTEVLARELLSALDYIHDAGIVHRDLKPANVLLGSEGRPLLTDFGVARAPEATRLTTAGVVVGTLRYLAPEVAAGGDATPRSDLYSCGMLLREAQRGRRSSPELQHLIALLTRRQPGERPASAGAAAELLAPPAETQPTATGPTEALPEATTAPLNLRDDGRQAGPPSAGATRTVAITPRYLATAAVLLFALLLGLGILSGGDAEPDAGQPAESVGDASLDQQLDRLERAVRSLPGR